MGWFCYHTKLRRLKSVLKAWHGEFKGKSKRQEEEIIGETEKGDSLAKNSETDQEELSLRMSLKADLLVIYRMEERNLIQKSKLNRLKLGDGNTNFFH